MYKVADEPKEGSKGHIQPCEMNHHKPIDHVPLKKDLYTLARLIFMVTPTLDWISHKVHLEEPTALLVVAKVSRCKISELEKGLGFGPYVLLPPNLSCINQKVASNSESNFWTKVMAQYIQEREWDMKHYIHV